MSKEPRKHGASFKAKVDPEALRGENTVAQLSAGYDVHPGQIQAWKKDCWKKRSGYSMETMTKGRSLMMPLLPGSTNRSANSKWRGIYWRRGLRWTRYLDSKEARLRKCPATRGKVLGKCSDLRGCE